MAVFCHLFTVNSTRTGVGFWHGPVMKCTLPPPGSALLTKPKEAGTGFLWHTLYVMIFPHHAFIIENVFHASTKSFVLQGFENSSREGWDALDMLSAHIKQSLSLYASVASLNGVVGYFAIFLLFLFLLLNCGLKKLNAQRVPGNRLEIATLKWHMPIITISLENLWKA